MEARSMREACEEPERDRRNRRRVTAWSLAWVLAWLGVVMAIQRAWIDGLPATLAALAAGALGAGTALAYLRFLRHADELRRKIELEALAFAYGTGIVGGLTYWTLGRAGVVDEADLVYVLAVMLLVHPIAVLVARRRYS